MDQATRKTPPELADVGVLFVHGIGEQQRADTLVQFGEGLKTWFERWLTLDSAPQPSVVVGVSDADLSQSTTATIPAHASLHLSAANVKTTWLLAESWWAASFAAPRYRDLWQWSLEIVPLAVADHFVRRFRLAKPWYRKVPELALLALAIALLPLLTLTMITALVVGILPIPRLRSAILGVQRILIGTVGDSYALLESSIRGAAMVSRVQHDLRWLQTMARKTIVVAHSQGAAVAHAALQPQDAPTPDVLFTFGAGVRKLLVLDELRVGRLKLWSLSGGLLLLSYGLWATYRVAVDPTLHLNLLTAQGVDPARVPLAFGFTMNLTDIFGMNLLNWRHVTGLATLFGAAMGLLAFRDSWRDRLLGGCVLGAFFAAGSLLYSVFMNVGPWSLMGFFSVVIGGSWLALGFSSLKIHQTDEAIDKRLDNGLQIRWLDRYARADPVPNGPLVSTPLPFVDSRPVSNFGSPLRDHSGYWRNEDQFLPVIAREIAYLAGIELLGGAWDAERLQWADARRTWRVKWLSVCRVLAAVVALSLLVRFQATLWRTTNDAPQIVATLVGELIDLAQRVPFLRLLVGDLAQSLLLQALWIGAVLACVGVTYKLFETAWSWWDRAETSALFARADYQRGSVPFLSLAAVLGCGVAAALVLTAFLDRQAYELWTTDPSLVALRTNGWGGARAASMQPGVYTTGGVAVVVSSVLGMFASALSDWWTWGDSRTEDRRFIWRSVGYGVLAFTFAMPAAVVIVEDPAGTSGWVNFAEALQVGALAMLAIAALWAMATTRLGRRLRRRLRDHSASPPFGRWLARGRGGQPAVSRERLCARAMELSTAWDELKAKPLDLRIVFSDEAAAIAEALVPPTNDDEEHAVSRLTDAFPYAALAAAERALVDDRALARRLIAPHAHAPLGAIRRRVRQIERLLGSSEVETVGVA